MRGPDQKQDAIFSYVSPEDRVPSGHPLWHIRTLKSEFESIKLGLSGGEPHQVGADPAEMVKRDRVRKMLQAGVL
jgi:hypothetical protein